MSAAPILLSPPDVGPDEEAAVLRAIRSGWVAPAGPELASFETEVAARVGVAHAVAVASGTAALHLGLVALGVGPGDVVLTSTLTFAATANAVHHAGATPWFVDVDPATGNVDPALLLRAAEEARQRGLHVGAVLPVDLLGKCADAVAIEGVGRSLGVPVLVDAAEAMGARRGGRAAGSFGNASVLSCNGNKVLTTSGGGLLLTDRADLADRVRHLSTQARVPGDAAYLHDEVGWNQRLSNLLAAVGRAQLARLDEMLARRRGNRERYRTLLAALGDSWILGGDDDAEDNCWLTAAVAGPSARWEPVGLAAALAAEGIETRPVWRPMHAQPAFVGAPSTCTGAADRLAARGLCLPSGSSLTEADLDRVERAIRAHVERR